MAFSMRCRVDGLGAEGLHEQPDRGGLADGVGHLDLDPLGQAGRDDVLGHPAHRVGRRTVHLGRILAGEGAAAVTGPAAVGVDDDLAAGQTGVAHGAADDELAGRIDQQPEVGDVQAFVGQFAQDGVDDVDPDVVGKLFLLRSTSAACWVESTTVSSRIGVVPSYWMVTCVLPSGRR